MVHAPPFLVITWITIVAKTQACSLGPCEPGKQWCVEDCNGTDCLGADCSGYRGCHEVCPPGTNGLGPITPCNNFCLLK